MLWLVKNGVPFDIAASLDSTTTAGWGIIFSELEGQKFNFETMKYED